MRNKLKPVLLLSCMAFAGAAFADTAEDLARIEAETAVLKATAKKVEVQAQIAAKQAEIDRHSMPAPVISGAAGLAAPALPSDPTVVAVEGIGKNRYATLAFGGGAVLEVKVGDTLPNGMKVQSIRGNEVIVGSGKNRVRLAHSSHAPSIASSGYGAAPSLPLPLPAPNFSAAQKGATAR